MCTHPFLLQGGGGVEPPIFQKVGGGGLTGPQLLDGICWEQGGDFIQGGEGGGCNFPIKINQNIKI